ncbi:MAG: DUF6268 family outer membrane beta-barrel protein [Chthoniobacteraceae bacterium]
MKPSFILTSLFLGTAASLPAGQILREPAPAQSSSSAVLSYDFEASYNASAPARSNVSPSRNADVSEQNTHVQAVISYAAPDKAVLRFGVGYDRYDFGFAGPGLIPGALQSVNLVAGLDLKIGDVLIRLEAQPGFYGDDRGFNSGDFNVPVILGASYLVSKDFQWIAGLYYNPNASNPVMGGLGFRWKMADRWTLNFVPPNPRIEFKATDDLTLYAGGQIIASTFRVNRNFGGNAGFRDYRNALVDYTEVRAGAGASWKLGGKGSIDLEAGYMAYRDFDYHKVGDNFQTKSGSVYGQVGVKMGF